MKHHQKKGLLVEIDSIGKNKAVGPHAAGIHEERAAEKENVQGFLLMIILPTEEVRSRLRLFLT